MKLLDDYFKLREEIFKHFNYVEDWRVLPFNDCRDYDWLITEDNSVIYGKKENILRDNDEFYKDEIYRNRYLPKWVYRADDYTMILVDTHIDGNQFLSIFDNDKEIKEVAK